MQRHLTPHPPLQTALAFLSVALLLVWIGVLPKADRAHKSSENADQPARAEAPSNAPVPGVSSEGPSDASAAPEEKSARIG